MKKTLLFIFSFLTLSLSAQDIKFDVLSNAGGRISNFNSASFTFGQPFVGSITNGTNSIRQGFQQPSFMMSNPPCNKSLIQSLSGFDPNPVYSYWVWSYDTLSITNTSNCDLRIRPEFAISHDSQIGPTDFDLKWYNPIFGSWPTIPYYIDANGHAVGYWSMGSDTTGFLITQGSTQQVIIKVRFRPSANYGTYTVIWKEQEVDSVGYSIQTLATDSNSLTLMLAGCTDPLACNYDPNATNNNGTCDYPNGCGDALYLEYDANVTCSDASACITLIVNGCTDPLACNYDPNATNNNGTCDYPNGCGDALYLEYDANVTCSDASACITLIVNGCTDPTAFNYNASATSDDGSCIAYVYGCTDPTMLNYNVLANTDDGTCIPFIYGCIDSTMLNYNPLANTNDGSCTMIVYGCMDSTMFNYNAIANVDDGSCVAFINGCTDITACTYDVLSNIDDGSCLYLDIFGICGGNNTIQMAIDSASPGDIINIPLGTYTEFLVINKSITLNAQAGVLLNVAGHTTGILIDDSTSDVTINSLTITGDNLTGSAITVNPGTHNITITNNIISSILLPGGGNASPLSYGILCWGNPSTGVNPPTNITITGNTISYVLGSAISLGTNTDSVSISGNTFSNIIPVAYSTTYLAVGIQAELSNVLDINNNTYDGLLQANNLANCTNTTISGNTYSNSPLMLNTTYPHIVSFNDTPWWNLIYATSPTEYFQAYYSDTNSVAYQSLVATYASYGMPIWATLSSSNPGCTDTLALNYNSAALSNNGSCIMPVYGCMDSTMFNFNPLANTDDGSCIPFMYGCMDTTMFNFNASANTDDGTCIPFIYGCIDSTMLNFDPLVNTDDGSCIAFIYGCTNPLAPNYNLLANTDDGSCLPYVYGCTDSTAYNYDTTATLDDGSCSYCDYMDNDYISDVYYSEISCNGSNDGSIFGIDLGTLILYNGTGPFTYSVDSGLTFQSSTTFSNLGPGNYYITYMDANGCINPNTSQYWLALSNPDSMQFTTSQNDVSCNGGNDGNMMIDVQYVNYYPYNLQWSDASTDSVMSNVNAGNYNVVITDANNCTDTVQFNISEPIEIATSISTSNVSCVGGSDGAAVTTISGGQSPYIFNWSNGATTTSVNNLTEGSHFVVVTDANNCSDTTFFDINSNPITVAYNITEVSCIGDDGAIDITVSGGQATYTFNWEKEEWFLGWYIGFQNFSSNEDLSGLESGDYLLTITDDNGCTYTDTISVDTYEILAASVVTDVSCYGGNDGSIDLTASGGVTPYSYLWNNGSNSEDISGLSAGTYDVNIIDNNGCSIYDTVLVSEAAEFLVNANITNDVSNCDGAIDITVNGATPPYTYDWQNANLLDTFNVTLAPPSASHPYYGNGQPLVYLLNGVEGDEITLLRGYTYYFIMDNVISFFPFYISTDAVGGSNYIGEVTNGVTNSGAINYETLTFTPDASHPDTLYYQSANGGYMGYRIILSDGNNSEDLTNICAGDYNLLITDANDCLFSSTYNVNDAFYGCTDSTMYNFNPLANINDGSCIAFVYGCMDSTMFNYNANATADDGSCIAFVYGCMDSIMFNYDVLANTDDESCISFIYGCTDPTMFNYDVSVNTDDGSCISFVYGCMDSTMFNYDVLANTDDGSCIAYVYGCTDSTQFNYNSLANTDDGSCISFVYGCMDSTQFNYNALANTDDGSCMAIAYGCIDSLALNFDPLANTDDGSCCYSSIEYIIADNLNNGNGVSTAINQNYNASSTDMNSNGTRFINGSSGSRSVKIYDLINNSWTLTHTISEPNDEQFGYSVSISNDGQIIAVGAPNNGPSVFNGGNYRKVRVYEFINNQWSQRGQTIQETEHRYGHTVKLSGDGNALAVSNHVNGVFAYRFNSVNGTWHQAAWRNENTNSSWLYNESSISLNYDGSIFAVGMPSASQNPNYGPTGLVEIISVPTLSQGLNGGNTIQLLSTYTLYPAGNDKFGTSISLDSAGTRIVIGSIYTANSLAGNVKIFERVSDPNAYNQFVQLGQTISGLPGIGLGTCVSINSIGNIVAISTIYESYVTVVEFNSGSWVQIGNNLSVNAGNYGNLLKFSSNGSKLLVGSTSNGTHIYKITQICSGCTDSLAVNYDPYSLIDDGTCDYLGCTDSLAFNYDPLATIDDSSCIASVYGCTDPTAMNYNVLANTDDGSCISFVYGCTDSTATNYDATANTDDGSCTNCYAVADIGSDTITACDSALISTNLITNGTYSWISNNNINYLFDFEGSPNCQEFDFPQYNNGSGWNGSGGCPTSNFNTTSVLGPFGIGGGYGEQIEIRYNNLANHDSINISFDLYIHDTWDGNLQPDLWGLDIDGVNYIHTTFSNDNLSYQSFPANYNSNNLINNLGTTGALINNLAGRCIWNAGYNSTLYNINLTIPHFTDSLLLELSSILTEGACDESWSIDNISISTISADLDSDLFVDRSGTYYLTVTDSLGCMATDSVYVHIDICGCTDSTALNYNSNATLDDGSCIATVYGCTDPTAMNYDALANTDDGSCLSFMYGCMDSTATNYNATANTDDGSCTYCYVTADIGSDTITACDSVLISTNPITNGSYFWNSSNSQVIVYPQIGTASLGGIIFYIDSINNNGLIASTNNVGASFSGGNVAWGCQGWFGTSTSLGSGLSNTNLIVNGCSSYPIAAKICNDYTVTENGITYDDWYLPSRDELHQIYLNIGLNGYTGGTSFWSSSEFSSALAWMDYFSGLGQNAEHKSTNNTHDSRAIRSFSFQPIIINPDTTNSVMVSTSGWNYVTVTDSLGCTATDSVYVHIDICGCTDPTAVNYNPSATSDDGSCIPCIYGCMDSTAYNYSTFATCDDGSCIPFIFGCIDNTAYNYDSTANINDGSCQYCDLSLTLFPTQNSSATTCDGAIFSVTSSSNNPIIYVWNSGQTNYFITGLCSGTYVLTVTDDVGCSVSDSVVIGSPVIYGCTDPTADNYDATATVDDGSCTYPPVSGCTDPSAGNYDPSATVDDGSCTSPSCNEDAPTGLFVDGIIHSRAVINWDNMNSSTCTVDQYRIRYRVAGTSGWTNKTMGGPLGSCTWGNQRIDKLLLGLTGSTTYEYQMKAWYCGGGASSWTSLHNFTTADNCPNVGNLAAYGATPTKATFTWDDSNGPYEFVRLKSRIDSISNPTGSDWFQIGGSGVSYGTFTKNKNGLTPGETYRAQARAFCDPNGGAYFSLSWSPLVYWTQPVVRVEGGTAIANLDVYPNPSRDVFNISFTSEAVQDLKVRILNVVGEVIISEDLDKFIGEYTKQINLHENAKGIYFLEIETNDGVVNKKLILQ